MKIMILEGVSPPTDGKKNDSSLSTIYDFLQASKSHSSKAPKSEPFLHVTSFGCGSATPVHTKTISPISSEMQTTSTPSIQPSSQADRLSTLIESVS